MNYINKLNSVIILALTIYGEARNQTILGQVAVGCVIRNRLKKISSYEASYKKVCLKPKQFSCWNEGDPNRSKLEELAEKIYLVQEIKDKLFEQCLFVARGIYSDVILDVTKKADHYLTKKLF